MDDRKFCQINEYINEGLSGLPFPLVATRLILCIVRLAEELEEAGRDPVKLARDAMLREEEDEG